MSIEKKEKNLKELMTKAINNSYSMSEASFLMGFHFNTFVKYAKKFGIYKPNQGLKGKIGKRGGVKEIDLMEDFRWFYYKFKYSKIKIRIP